MNLKLTVVDQTPVHGSHAAVEAPQLSVQLAQTCDTLGYHRYWVAEHHDSVHFANPSPEILLTRIASATQNLRVGSGGVMLSHYSPYKVAECFRMLATLFPGRIDLGIGRAPGGSGMTSAALAYPHQPSHGDHYPQQARDLKSFLDGDMPATHPFSQLHVLPDDNPTPETWMLGSGGGGAGLAGQLGYHLALARFIAPDRCSPTIFDAHRAKWTEAGHEGTPKCMLAIGCICADTEEEARFIAGTAVYRKLMMDQGIAVPFLPPAQVRDVYQKLPRSQQASFDHILDGYTVGTSEQCLNDMQRLSKQFGTNEVGLVTVTYDFNDRMRSYRLLAEENESNDRMAATG